MRPIYRWTQSICSLWWTTWLMPGFPSWTAEWPDGHSGGRDLWQDTDPCLLWHQERDGWRNPWFLDGWWEVIPTPTWLSPSVCDAWQLPSRLCHCGAKVSPHWLHLDENIESAIVPYLAAHLVSFSDAFRHPAGMVKVAGMVKDPKDPSRWGDLMGVIQVMTPLSVCSSLSCWTLQ